MRLFLLLLFKFFNSRFVVVHTRIQYLQFLKTGVYFSLVIRGLPKSTRINDDVQHIYDKIDYYLRNYQFSLALIR